MPKRCYSASQPSLQVVINSYDDYEHPLHLHGHTTYILARGEVQEGLWSPSAPNGQLQYNNPAARDVYSVNALSYLVLQFKANNPAVWFFHCHIDW
jgi:FtsP/CotA-like multicopper oxidase with cupredoxin domain